MIREIRHETAFVLTGHCEAMVHVPRLEILHAREEWDPEALRNHLWAVYGVKR